jgi:hypothetical protein
LAPVQQSARGDVAVAVPIVARAIIIIKRYFMKVPPVEFHYISLTVRASRRKLMIQTRGGGTGGRSDRDDDAAISLKNFCPRSGEKIKTDAEARNNESPTLQAEQHRES